MATNQTARNTVICRVIRWFKSRLERKKRNDLKKLMHKIMANQQDIVAQLKAAKAKQDSTLAVLVRVGEETDFLQTKIVELQAIIDQGGTIGQDLIDAAKAVADGADAVAAAADADDAKVPNKPTEPPTEPPAQPPVNPDNP